MSYHYYSIDGYGITDDDLKSEIDVTRLMKLIEMSPELKKKFDEWFETNTYGLTTSVILDDFCEHLNGYTGLMVILKEVIWDVEKIEFTISNDFDDVNYLLLEPAYPWYRPQKERYADLTEEKVQEVLNKYLSVVTDDKFDIGYYSCENGG